MKERYTPKAGDYVQPDQWKIGETLAEDDGFSDYDFPGCQFRLPAKDYRLAVNVTVTGGSHCLGLPGPQWRSRCKIEFVGDGEPSEFSGGWIYHKDRI